MASDSPPPVRRREIVAWAMFDFANSSYTTLIVTVGFGIYFTKLVAAGERADFLWGAGIFASNLLVMLLGTVLGAMADDMGRKKLFLFGTYALCVLGTLGLYFVLPGDVALGLALFVVSNLGFALGENFTAAFLPELSTPANVGRVSGFGWGLGYFGGLGSLVACWSFLAGGFSLENLENLRRAWLVTGLFFLVAALPTFLFLRERARRGPARRLPDYARVSFRRIAETAVSLAHFSQLARFLGAFFLFSCGLTSVIAFAAIYAERTIGFTAKEVVFLFIALQLASAAGAFAFGLVQDRLGSRRTIQIALGLWVLVCVGAFAATSKGAFWLVAAGAGLGIGSLQAASRGLVGLFSPVAKSGEFFGLWGFAGKGAYMLGPLLFGAISSASGSQRLAILSTALFFVAGWVALGFVDERRGQAAALAWSEAGRAGTSGGPAGERGAGGAPAR
jgi:UMF1 family MFS transporter